MRAKYPACPVEIMPVQEFTFLAPAHYVGTTEDQRRDPVARYWNLCDPDACDGVGAESFRSFYQRIDTAVTLLKQRAERRIQVICHGYVIKAILWRQLHPGVPVTAEFMRGFLGFHRHYLVKNAQIFAMHGLPDGEWALASPQDVTVS